LHKDIHPCRFIDVKALSSVCRLLGDEARLRLLRLLARERLNVSELTAILGMAQSGVSRHLGLLKEAGLVEERREGGFAWYRAAEAAAGEAGALWPALRERLAASADATTRADEARLTEVLRVRKERFARHAGESGQLVPGRSWAAWSRALGHLLPPCEVADLGCGEGYLTVEAARWAREVIAVDRSAEALREARALARRRGVSNVVWKRGEIEALPLPDARVDVALLSQALHHAADPATALAEARRILRPGGQLLVLDLRAHDQQWVTERLGDRWLGFRDQQLAALLTTAGFAEVRVGVGATLRGDPFTVLVASGRHPGAPRRARSTTRGTTPATKRGTA
jgi:SAM-dependent methyltransferase